MMEQRVLFDLPLALVQHLALSINRGKVVRDL
jgi:hypothetical protein